MAKSPLGRSSSSNTNTINTNNNNNNNTSSQSSSLNTMGYCMIMGVLCCCCNILYICSTVMTGLHHTTGFTTSLAINSESFHQIAVNSRGSSNRIQDRPRQTLSPEWKVVETGDVAMGDDDPIRQLLREALGGGDDGKQQSSIVIDETTLQRLPSVKDVTALYGSTPVVLGLETCDVFQHHHPTILDAAEHLVSVAGSFNTGTNLLAELLIANCYMPERKAKYQTSGVRWQVLWGKHTPVDDEQFRTSHRTYSNETGPNHEPPITSDMIFPAITIRDPFKWMQSMCRHEYGAHWLHDPSHCPNLVPNEVDEQLFEANGVPPTTTMKVTAKYAEFSRQHVSLVEFWNEWNLAYVQAAFPRLMVRFEDIVFHPKQVTQMVCECAGGKIHPDTPFRYVVESAKKGSAHGTEKTSYVDALVKYGTEAGRYTGFTEDDLEYARKHLDPDLMRLFGYHYPSPHNRVTIEQ